MKNFKEFMEDVDSDESPIETRATAAKKATAVSKEKVGSVSRSSSSITFNRSKGALPRFGRRKKMEDE
jgi:hypothetical protein|tara:strand:+ start:171 stop:374 length:204 start_codon:yes stop_codon:yes gene_type:complete